jgi:hypothetical protein
MEKYAGNYPSDNRGYNLLDDLTLFLDLIANGLMPADYYDFLAESGLIAIPK